MWLLLNESLAPGTCCSAPRSRSAAARVLAALQPPAGRVRAVAAAALVELLWLVLVDIVRSNIAVARIVLGLGSGAAAPPASSRCRSSCAIPAALAVLACIITATPGTSWARYDAARNVLTIHVLDLVDEEAWIRQFKERYERRLMEIFE